MKHALLLIFTLFLGTLFAQDNSKPRLSASTAQYLWKQDHLNNGKPQIFKECVYRQDASGRIYLASFIKVKPSLDEQQLKALDIVIGSKSKDIWTAYIPLEHVKSFTQIQGIDCIDIDRPTAIQMDSARIQARIDSVHNGINLPQAYDGSGVVVGIIDAGFDYTHPAFFDTSYTHYRLKSVWEQKGTGTAPSAFGFGAEYTDSTTIFDKGYDTPDFSHGSHVAGIAGGSGYGGPSGNNQQYRGVAYNSDLVFVGILPELNMWLNSGLTDMMDGIQYVYDYATAVSKPAVANISWGGPIGPHDGMSLFSQGCDNATGQGRLLTLSAGNNGGKRVHFQKTFTATDTIIKTFMLFPSGLPSKTNWVDVWGEAGQQFGLQFTLYGSPFPLPVTSSAIYYLDDQTHQIELVGSNGDTCFITLTTVTNEYNGKTHMLLDIYSRVLDNLLITVRGDTGTVDMWQGYILGAYGYYGSFSTNSLAIATNGDDVMSSSDMASTHSALAVGAYTSRSSFTNISGATLGTGMPLYNISGFSSRGPTADGRAKPNIAAPGSMIASAVSSVDPSFFSGGADYDLVMNQFVSPLNGTTYSYAVLQGTSMSSPLAAGVLALMLQANPELNPVQVQTALYSTAIQDAYTGTIPSGGSNIWGWGKINAYGAVHVALTFVGIYHEPNSSLQGLVYPNPSEGDYFIELNADRDETIKLLLFDVNGRLITQTDWVVANGVNTYQPNWQHLAAGIYFVKLIGQSGELNIKLVKY